MAHTWNDLLAFLRDHGDVFVAGLALIVLAEAAVIYLWARRAGELRARAEESLHGAERAQVEVARLQAELARLEESTRQPAGRTGLYRVRGPEGEARPAAPPANGQPVEAPGPPPVTVAAMPPVPPPPPLASAPAAPPTRPVENGDGPAPRTPAYPDRAAAASPTASRAASWATSLETAAALTGPAPAPAGGTPEPGDGAPAAGGAAAGASPASWAALLGDAVATGTTPPAAPPAPDPRSSGHATPAGWGEMPAGSPAAPAPAPGSSAVSPAWPGPVATDAQTPAPPVASGEATDDVLLVEDDDNVARLYRTLLESRGFSLRHAEDGVAGLEEVHRRRPGLILLDMMMPRMNGITFLQSMREEPALADVPVVVLSNFREERLVERATALGALEYLVKAQTRPAALVDAIPHWMRGTRVG